MVIQNRRDRGLFWNCDVHDWCELTFATTLTASESEARQHKLPAHGELIHLPRNRFEEDKTNYCRAVGYRGRRPVLVCDGHVVNHRGKPAWFDFLRRFDKPSTTITPNLNEHLPRIL